MSTYEDTLERKILNFIDNLRSENSRNLTRKIINLLLNRRKEAWKSVETSSEWDGGWVRSREIFKETAEYNPRTITRLLTELSDERIKIIERKQCKGLKGIPGGPPVFYRLPDFFLPDTIPSSEELLPALNAFALQSLAAQMIFFERTGENLQPLVKQRVKQLEENSRKFQKEILEGGIKEKDPCQSVERP